MALCNLVLSFSLLVATACTTSIAGTSDSPGGPDAGSERTDETGADASVPVSTGPEDITLQATSSNNIAAENSISCNGGEPDFIHADNRYYRLYDLAASGVSGDLSVTSVDIGIEQATSSVGSQNIVVTLHTLSGTLEVGDLTPIASSTVSVPNQALGLLNVPMTATVPAGNRVVVEVFTPDGVGQGNRLFIGSNREIESSPSYILAPVCGISQRTPLANLGIAGLAMSLVLNINGQHQPQ